MTDTTRDAFEASPLASKFNLEKSRGGSYLYAQPSIAWKAWKAATLAERERQSFEATGVQGLAVPPTGKGGNHV